MLWGYGGFHVTALYILWSHGVPSESPCKTPAGQGLYLVPELRNVKDISIVYFHILFIDGVTFPNENFNEFLLSILPMTMIKFLYIGKLIQSFYIIFTLI